MLETLSIKALYTPALAEGEGVGTAYEYYTKRLVLGRWLAGLPRPRSILIAGLPQKYGSSLDFFLIAHELTATLTVVDERPAAIEKAQRALQAAQNEGGLLQLSPNFVLVQDMGQLAEMTGSFDLALSSEVLQRLTTEQRVQYVQRTGDLAAASALFCPNADNESHVGISGLGGLTLAEVRALVPQPSRPIEYIDLPPFPPGITRSDEQREQATSGRTEALAMWGLGYYARMERWFPAGLRRKYAHIVYALRG